jgi:hypothetical protein
LAGGPGLIDIFGFYLCLWSLTAAVPTPSLSVSVLSHILFACEGGWPFILWFLDLWYYWCLWLCKVFYSDYKRLCNTYPGDRVSVADRVPFQPANQQVLFAVVFCCISYHYHHHQYHTTYHQNLILVLWQSWSNRPRPSTTLHPSQGTRTLHLPLTAIAIIITRMSLPPARAQEERSRTHRSHVSSAVNLTG